MMEIIYRQFKEKLLKMGYSEKEAAHLYGSVQEMDEQSRTWVKKWLNTGMLPRDEIEGVTAEYLIDEYKYAPLNAFIILDWLKSDPQAAKYFLLKAAVPAQIDESVVEEVRSIMGEAPQAMQPDETEGA